MHRPSEVLTKKINGIVDWFIPPSVSADKESGKQARIFLISHLFGPFLGNTVPAALYLVDPTPGYPVLILALSITSFWIYPFLLKAGVPYVWIALFSVQNLIFSIFWSCLFYGGVNSPTLPWVLTIPLLAFFYLGPMRSARQSVFGMFALNLVALLLVYAAGFEPSNDLPAAAAEGLGLVSTVAASLYVVMMSFYYSSILASQGELELEMRGHLATAADLRKATIDAEQASLAKAEFLAKMSHELRTPLNAVIGYSQMLLEDADAEGDVQSKADLDRILNSGQHLLKIVNEVLDLSKLEAGKMTLYEEEVAIGPELAKTAARFAAMAEKKGLAIRVEIDDSVGSVRCDSEKVRNVVEQLMDNAVKFTDEGEVSLTVTREGPPGPSGSLFIAVRDSGIGITPDDKLRLFESFVGSGDFSTSKYGGTGIGLALSQRYCKLMGGEIEAVSTSGIGSCFSVRLPMERPRPAAEKDTTDPLADEPSRSSSLPVAA